MKVITPAEGIPAGQTKCCHHAGDDGEALRAYEKVKNDSEADVPAGTIEAEKRDGKWYASAAKPKKSKSGFWRELYRGENRKN